MGVLVWAGFIISLNYITFPGLAKDGGPKDITFIASVFTGCLATFSVDVGKKKKDGKDKEKLPSAIPTQTIRIEQAPIKIVTAINSITICLTTFNYGKFNRRFKKTIS